MTAGHPVDAFVGFSESGQELTTYLCIATWYYCMLPQDCRCIRWLVRERSRTNNIFYDSCSVTNRARHGNEQAVHTPTCFKRHAPLLSFSVYVCGMALFIYACAQKWISLAVRRVSCLWNAPRRLRGKPCAPVANPGWRRRHAGMVATDGAGIIPVKHRLCWRKPCLFSRPGVAEMRGLRSVILCRERYRDCPPPSSSGCRVFVSGGCFGALVPFFCPAPCYPTTSCSRISCRC